MSARNWLILWLACLLVGSFLPWPKVAIGTAARFRLIDLIPYPLLSAIFGDAIIVNPHRVIHYVAFAVTALLVISPRRTMLAGILAAFSICLLALFIETAQHLVFHNAFEGQDVIDDSAGVVNSFVIVRIARALYKNGSANREAS